MCEVWERLNYNKGKRQVRQEDLAYHQEKEEKVSAEGEQRLFAHRLTRFSRVAFSQ